MAGRDRKKPRFEYRFFHGAARNTTHKVILMKKKGLWKAEAGRQKKAVPAKAGTAPSRKRMEQPPVVPPYQLLQ
jgi:hypothetical protein